MIIELFSLDVMGEEFRANIDWKSPFLKGVGHFGPKFYVEGDILLTICAGLDRRVNALQLCH